MSLEIELPDFDEKIEKHRGLKRYVQLLADAWFRTPKRIAGTVCLILACFTVIGWNLSRLSILDEVMDLEVREFELKDTLSDIELKLTEFNEDELLSSIEAENDKIFHGFPELAAWTESLSRIALDRGILLAFTVEKPHKSAVPGVLEVPVELQFKAQENAADNLFVGSMDMVGMLLRDHWHIDVIATSGTGSGQKLDALSVKTQVWVKDRYGFVDAETLKREAAESDDFEDDEFIDA